MADLYPLDDGTAYTMHNSPPGPLPNSDAIAFSCIEERNHIKYTAIHYQSGIICLVPISGFTVDTDNNLFTNVEDTPMTSQLSASVQGSRLRLNWTASLHRRFVAAVLILGVKSAVPRTVLQLINAPGLTRENVASHLQKFRLAVKRQHNLPSTSHLTDDHIPLDLDPELQQLAVQAAERRRGGHSMRENAPPPMQQPLQQPLQQPMQQTQNQSLASYASATPFAGADALVPSQNLFNSFPGNSLSAGPLPLGGPVLSPHPTGGTTGWDYGMLMDPLMTGQR